MTVFWTADHHIGHERIIELCRRPFASIEEHDEFLVRRWNDVVGDDDVVHVLGDVAMGNITASLAHWRRMRGTKILYHGNHDRTFRRQSRVRREQWADRYRGEGGFAEVITRRHNWAQLSSGLWVAVSHFPYGRDENELQRSHWPVDNGRWLLHGHVHTQWLVNGRQINVGVDKWGFTPVAEEVLVEIIESAGRS